MGLLFSCPWSCRDLIAGTELFGPPTCHQSPTVAIVIVVLYLAGCCVVASTSAVFTAALREEFFKSLHPRPLACWSPSMTLSPSFSIIFHIYDTSAPFCLPLCPFCPFPSLPGRRHPVVRPLQLKLDFWILPGSTYAPGLGHYFFRSIAFKSNHSSFWMRTIALNGSVAGRRGGGGGGGAAAAGAKLSGPFWVEESSTNREIYRLKNIRLFISEVTVCNSHAHPRFRFGGLVSTARISTT